MILMSRMKLNRYILSVVTVMTFVMTIWGQACSSNVGFIGLSSPSSGTESSSSSQPSLGSPTTDGNGNTYDGKIRVIHHYVENEKFWCNDHVMPESVLYRLDDATNEWFYIQNYKESCQSAAAVKVSGVAYNDALVTASYDGKSYVRPRDLIVNPKEDPNLSDKNLYDGICADVNNKCSLRAASEQANFILTTSDIRISVLSGIYKITKPLDVAMNSGHKLFIIGEGAAGSIIDAQKATNHFNFKALGGQVNIEKLSLINGALNTAETFPYDTASSIVDQSFGLTSNIVDCEFKNNDTSKYVIKSEHSLNMNILRSTFTNNTTSLVPGSVIRTFGTGLSIEDSVVANNIGMGINVENQTFNVKIKNSAVYNNSSVGIYFMLCFGCEIANSTIYNNGLGISLNSLNMGGPGSDYNVKVTNSTIVDNVGIPGGGNINLGFHDPTTRLILNNSVVAIHDASKANCTAGGYSIFSNHGIASSNSLYDDVSCSILSGAGNILGVDPKLGSLANNGGQTPTMLPLTGSPLIDAGDNLSCMPLDQRGQLRPVNKLGLPTATCDIGAVELQ